MKSMTIHGIDDQLAKLIKSKAQSEGLSINKTIKKMLEVSLGVKPLEERKNMDVFREFYGLWTKADQNEFEEQTADTRTIDSKDWQ